MSTNADIAKCNDDIFAVDISERYAFINDRAVSRHSLQRRCSHFRGCQDIIEQSHFSEIREPSKVKSEKARPVARWRRDSES